MFGFGLCERGRSLTRPSEESGGLKAKSARVTRTGAPGEFGGVVGQLDAGARGVQLEEDGEGRGGQGGVLSLVLVLVFVVWGGGCLDAVVAEMLLVKQKKTHRDQVGVLGDHRVAVALAHQPGYL